MIGLLYSHYPIRSSNLRTNACTLKKPGFYKIYKMADGKVSRSLQLSCRLLVVADFLFNFLFSNRISENYGNLIVVVFDANPICWGEIAARQSDEVLLICGLIKLLRDLIYTLQSFIGTFKQLER